MNKLYVKTVSNRLKLFYPAVILFVLLGSMAANAQQRLNNYAQFADNVTPFNPAYSLLDKAGSVNTLLSRQFVEIQTGAPTYFLFNLNIPFESMNAAGGLILKNNSIGPETLTEINAFFAKSIQLTDKDFLSVSLNAGFQKYVFQDPDPTDPEFSDIRQNTPNLGFGVMFYSDNYYVGLSVPELTIRNLGNASAQSQADLENHYYICGAILAPLDEDFTFKPASIIAYSQHNNVVASVSGTLYIKNTLGLGVDYRTDKQVAGILSYTLDYFRLGYSYQVGTSSNNLGAINNATHEVTLSYRFGRGSGTQKLL